MGAGRTFNADGLCLGHGLIPAIEAAQLAGAALGHALALGVWEPQAHEDGSTDVKGLWLCGDGAERRGAAAPGSAGRGR